MRFGLCLLCGGLHDVSHGPAGSEQVPIGQGAEDRHPHGPVLHGHRFVGVLVYEFPHRKVVTRLSTANRIQSHLNQLIQIHYPQRIFKTGGFSGIFQHNEAQGTGGDHHLRLRGCCLTYTDLRHFLI